MILITGAAGYIGSHTTIELIKAGYEVILIDNFSNSKSDVMRKIGQITGKDVACYNVDIRNELALDSIFASNKISAVIHFAGLKAVGESVEKPLDYFDNNVVGSINLIRLMQKHLVKTLVFSSSATVYGVPDTVPIMESAPLRVTNPYGRTKLFVEEILRDLFCSDPTFKIAILRYFNPVGAHKSGLIGEDPKGVPNNLIPYIGKVAMGELDFLSIFGSDYPTPDGTGLRDYIHVVDLALGHLKALEKLSRSGGIHTFNLGTGQAYSVLEMIKAYEGVSGKVIETRVVKRRAGDIAVCFADTKFAEHELGWVATRGLTEMCEDSWRWQQSQYKENA